MLGWFGTVWAQESNEVYLFSRDLAARLEKDTLAWKYQIGATEYSFGGYYHKALETWDRNGGGRRKLTNADTAFVSTFQKRNAREYILERSKKERLIILNEAHHNSRHRVFTASLLEGLYRNGYRFLGLEALADSLVMKRGFPVMESGYYTQESQMANLIYEAMKLGFTVFGYEADENAGGKDREIGQASNIARLMAANPQAGFLIHCGYDHGIEGTPNDPSWEKSMAGRLKEMTAINPFTIDQVAYSEKGNPDYTSSFVGMMGTDYPLILTRADGQLFNGPVVNDQVDCRIIHPFTREIGQRPDWLRMGGKRKEFRMAKKDIPSFPVLVLAYRKGEWEKKGVPADLVEVLDEKNIPSLILSPGNYTLVFKGADYKVIRQQEIQIK